MTVAPRPLRLDVMGQEMTIAWVAPSERLWAAAINIAGEDRDTTGLAELEISRIAVRDRGAPAAERQTLMHEIVHSVLWLTGHDTKDDDPLVQALSSGLLQVLRANPHLVAYLLQVAE